MTALTQTSNILSKTSSIGNFHFEDFYAPQDSSADNILEKVKECLFSLENAYDRLNAPKVAYYNYLKFHWNLSQQLFDSHEKTAKKIQSQCHKLLLHGVAK